MCDFLCTTQRERRLPSLAATHSAQPAELPPRSLPQRRAEPPSRHESQSEADSVTADEREVTRRLSRFSQRQLADACRDPNTPADIRAIAVRFLIPETAMEPPTSAAAIRAHAEPPTPKAEPPTHSNYANASRYGSAFRPPTSDHSQQLAAAHAERSAMSSANSAAYRSSRRCSYRSSRLRRP